MEVSTSSDVLPEVAGAGAAQGWRRRRQPQAMPPQLLFVPQDKPEHRQIKNRQQKLYFASNPVVYLKMLEADLVVYFGGIRATKHPPTGSPP